MCGAILVLSLFTVLDGAAETEANDEDKDFDLLEFCESSHVDDELYGEQGSDVSLEAVLESVQLSVAIPLK